jgi:hypothetical protein
MTSTKTPPCFAGHYIPHRLLRVTSSTNANDQPQQVLEFAEQSAPKVLWLTGFVDAIVNWFDLLLLHLSLCSISCLSTMSKNVYVDVRWESHGMQLGPIEDWIIYMQLSFFLGYDVGVIRQSDENTFIECGPVKPSGEYTTLDKEYQPSTYRFLSYPLTRHYKDDQDRDIYSH